MQKQTNLKRSQAADSIWPDEDETRKHWSRNSAEVPHFLCRTSTDDGEREPRSGRHWLNGKSAKPAADQPEDKPVRKFLPLSPNLHRMMKRPPAARSALEPPALAKDFSEPDRSGLLQGISIAACLVLATGIGFAVIAEEFKGQDPVSPKLWTSSLMQMLPSLEAKPREIKRLPTVGQKSAVAQPQPAAGTTGKKILSARLTVKDAAGATMTPIALQLAAEPSRPGEPVMLHLSGLPEDALLSAGRKRAGEGWVVEQQELAGLNVKLPADTQDPVLVTVAAIEPATGKLAAPMQEMRIKVTAASAEALPAAVEVPATVTQALTGQAALKANLEADGEAMEIRKRGDETLALGDVFGARGFYMKALDLGDKAAAGRIGRTYDPIVFETVGVHGIKPDAKMAEQWYRRAISEGDGSAYAELGRLKKLIAQ
jgi:hypothetical protein